MKGNGSARICASIWLLFLLPCLGCSTKLPPRKPQQTLDITKPLVVSLTSTPAGAEVFRVGEDGARGEKLGQCPVEIREFELGKEEWRFQPGTPPPPVPADRTGNSESGYYELSEPGYSRTGQEGPPLQLRYLVEKEGYETRLVTRELAPRDLRKLWEDPRIEIHVELRKKPVPSP
jgi:hypothetical protein